MSDFKFKPEILFLSGCTFFILYWIFGYDGITFSDDVLYLQYGWDFWKGNEINDDIHFTERWGAYLFSGFFTWIFGFSDRAGTIASLLAYLIAYVLLYHLQKSQSDKFWLTAFFCTQIYFLHFLTKVYPDSLLVLWVTLVPWAAVYRRKKPVLTALVMASAFMIGFSTKETMVLLLPFPVILFLFDWKRGNPLQFYYWFGFWSFVLLGLFFGYYHWKSGDIFHRFNSVNAGHYISEYTYHDKGWQAILKRLTYQPLLTFVQRSYWIWLVFAIPGLYKGLKKNNPVIFEFSLATCCLFAGFWLMSSTLDFYNPIYLNPRHLIILIGPLAVLIAAGSTLWLRDPKWRRLVVSLLSLGVLWALIQSDVRMGAYLLAVSFLYWIGVTKNSFKWMFLLILIVPVVGSIFYQYQIKNYRTFTKTFKQNILNNENQEVIVVNNFVYFSRNVLIPAPAPEKKYLLQIEDWAELRETRPMRFQLYVYQYYRHAYPAEQGDLDDFNQWLETSDYRLATEIEDKWVLKRSYVRR